MKTMPILFKDLFKLETELNQNLSFQAFTNQGGDRNDFFEALHMFQQVQGWKLFPVGGISPISLIHPHAKSFCEID